MRNISLFLILPFFLFGGCASQQIAKLEKDVQAIRQELQAADTKSTMQEEDLRSAYARMRSELDALRVELQKIRGQYEEDSFAGAGTGQRGGDLSDELVFLKDELLKLSNRVQHLSEYVGLETAAVIEEKTPSGKGGKATPAPLDADALYNSAKQAFDNGNLEKAQKEFTEILTRFPKSAVAGNAQFWLGEIYYRGNSYEKAILEYQKVIEKYPKGSKVASALLKQGLAFEKLGQKSNARLVLEDLVKRYPGSSETLIAQKKLRQM